MPWAVPTPLENADKIELLSDLIDSTPRRMKRGQRGRGSWGTRRTSLREKRGLVARSIEPANEEGEIIIRMKDLERSRDPRMFQFSGLV